MEYYGALLNLFDLSRTEGNTVFHFNVPCAVCMAKGTVNQVMMEDKLCFLNDICVYTFLLKSLVIDR